MSWFSDLAERAETFLNKVDQSAAEALQQKEDAKNRERSFHRSFPTDNNVYAQPPIAPRQMQTNTSESSTVTSSTSKPGFKRLTSTPKKSKKEDDEILFEFLNSPDTGTSKVTSNRASSPNNHMKTDNQVPPVPIDSVTSNTSTTDGSEVQSEDKDLINQEMIQDSTITQNRMSPGPESHEDLVDKVSQTSKSTEGEENVSVVNPPDHTIWQTQQQLTALELENNLLRSEVSSLNKDMSELMQAKREVEAENKRINQQIDNWNGQLSNSDRIVRELQSRETDLQQALSAKDSQLAVLRVCLQDTDKELNLKKELLNKVQTENERLLQEHLEGRGQQSEAVQRLQDRLQDAESKFEKIQRESKTREDEMSSQLIKLEDEHSNLSTALAQAEHVLSEEKKKNSDILTKFKAIQATVDASKSELSEYKQKAQRILQSKDKLISNLKENGPQQNGEADPELEQLRQECELLRDELVQCNGKLNQKQEELEEAEQQIQRESQMMAENRRRLDELLQEERTRKETLENECSALKEEMVYTKETLTRQQTMVQSRLHDREREIDKLQRQLTAKQISSSSQTELESRLRTLTESLIHKQTMLEALSTEKNSLVLQLERLEKHVRESQSVVKRGNATSVNVHADEDVKTKTPSFLLENHMDSGVTRRVKRAYSCIDSFSVQLGVFLRRYPIARIFVLAYMLLLHVWVFIILLTYTPEIHTTAYSKSPK